MTEDKFCRDCGCEILCELDMGFEDEDIEARSIFPGHPQKEIIFKPFYICAGCKDDADREWEAFKKTPEYELECSYIRFCRQFDDDAYYREEVNA